MRIASHWELSSNYYCTYIFQLEIYVSTINMTMVELFPEDKAVAGLISFDICLCLIRHQPYTRKDCMLNLSLYEILKAFQAVVYWDSMREVFFLHL